MAVGYLSPEHYEPRPLPREVATYSSALQTLAPGSAGKVAILDLSFAPVDGRTELVHRFQKSPLHITRPLYFDPERPDLAIVIAMSAGAGLLQGDRQKIDVSCERGSALLLTTQGATKVMGMDGDYATSVVDLTIERDCLLEYLPDAIIPCAGSRSYHELRLSVGEGSTVIASETIRAGRLAHGERHAYDVLASDLIIRRPDGPLLAVDRIRLSPGAAGGLGGPGVLGDEGQLATLYVVSDAAPPGALAEELRRALEGAPDVRWGVSELPHECGAWVRLLGDESPRVDRAMGIAWDAARKLLIGAPAPRLRKSKTYMT